MAASLRPVSTSGPTINFFFTEGQLSGRRKLTEAIFRVGSTSTGMQTMGTRAPIDLIVGHTFGLSSALSSLKLAKSQLLSWVSERVQYADGSGEVFTCVLHDCRVMIKKGKGAYSGVSYAYKLTAELSLEEQ